MVCVCVWVARARCLYRTILIDVFMKFVGRVEPFIWYPSAIDWLFTFNHLSHYQCKYTNNWHPILLILLHRYFFDLNFNLRYIHRVSTKATSHVTSTKYSNYSQAWSKFVEIKKKKNRYTRIKIFVRESEKEREHALILRINTHINTFKMGNIPQQME